MRLEPISKTPEEDNEAGELDKTKKVVSVVLPTHEDAALPLHPSEEAFDEPTSNITAWSRQLYSAARANSKLTLPAAPAGRNFGRPHPVPLPPPLSEGVARGPYAGRARFWGRGWPSPWSIGAGTIREANAHNLPSGLRWEAKINATKCSKRKHVL
jgi:hypothetical protein